MKNAAVVEHGLTPKMRKSLVFHSLIAVMVGLLAGFLWLIILHGELQFWPLPSIKANITDGRDLADNAHTGPIMNGLLILAIVGVSSYISLSARLWKWVYYGALAQLYGNSIGYQTAMLAPNRGLQPIDGFWNVFTYFVFYIAVAGVLIVVSLCLFGVYQSLKES